MSNNFEQLQLATLRLSQDGSIKDRLFEAYATHLEALETEELPESIRKEFGALNAAMHREPPVARESAVRASVRKMSAMEASQCAALVVRLFAAMARIELGRPGSGRSASAPVVQLFAADA